MVDRRKQGSSLDEAVHGLVEAEAPAGTHLDRIVIALRVAAAADRVARAEALAARELDGASWADVGRALGVSRQTAHERFRTR